MSLYKKLSLIFIVSILSQACTSIPEREAVVPEGESKQVVDIHAHFFNGMDLEPGNFARLAGARIKSVRAGSIATNNMIKKTAKFGLKRLAEDSCLEDINSSKKCFSFKNKVNIPESLVDYNHKWFNFELSDFVEAAATSRQGIILAYAENYPEVDLVTPSYVDLQGFAEGKRCLNKEVCGKNKNTLKYNKVSDSWGTGFESLKVYATDSYTRHSYQRKLAKDFNYFFRDKLTIIPFVGFNPMNGVRDRCEQNDYKCKKYFHFFQWQEPDSTDSKQTTLNPEEYVDRLFDEFFQNKVEPNFLGIKIYPQAGFYPIANCKNTIRQFKKNNPLTSLIEKNSLGSFNKSLPYAPLLNVWNKIKTEKPVEDSCKTIVRALNAHCPNGTCKKSNLYKQVKIGVDLALEFDKQLDKMWLYAYLLDLPIITHSSPGGAKQGIDFEKYGSLQVWANLDQDLKNILPQTSKCSDKKLRVLLAHSGADETFENNGFRDTVNLVYRNLKNKESCVKFYIDFSDSFLGREAGNLDKALKILESPTSETSLKAEISLRVKLFALIEAGRVAYGTDYFMNTLSNTYTPNEFYSSHSSFISRWKNELSSKARLNYFSNAAFDFYGFNSGRNQGCQRAETWLKFEQKPTPSWFNRACGSSSLQAN